MPPSGHRHAGKRQVDLQATDTPAVNPSTPVAIIRFAEKNDAVLGSRDVHDHAAIELILLVHGDGDRRATSAGVKQLLGLRLGECGHGCRRMYECPVGPVDPLGVFDERMVQDRRYVCWRAVDQVVFPRAIGDVAVRRQPQL